METIQLLADHNLLSHLVSQPFVWKFILEQLGRDALASQLKPFIQNNAAHLLHLWNANMAAAAERVELDLFKPLKSPEEYDAGFVEDMFQSMVNDYSIKTILIVALLLDSSDERVQAFLRPHLEDQSKLQWSLNVMTYNIFGQAKSVAPLIKEHNPDLLFCQETAHARFTPTICRALHYPYYNNAGYDGGTLMGGYGISYASRYPTWEDDCLVVEGNHHGRCAQFLTVAIMDYKVTTVKLLRICHTHLDHINEYTRLDEVKAFMKHGKVRPKTEEPSETGTYIDIFVGDFNALYRHDYGGEKMWRKLIGDSPYSPPVGSQAFEDHFNIQHLVMEYLTETMQFSIVNPRKGDPIVTAHNVVRVDYITYDAQFAKHFGLVDCRHIVSNNSDHYPVSAQFQFVNM